MIRIAFAVLTLLAIAGVASATCAVRARRVVVQQAVVVKKVAVVKAVVALPVAVYDPRILVLNGYHPYQQPVAPALTPPAPAAAPTPSVSNLDAVIQILQGMKGQLNGLDARLKAVENAVNLPAPREEKAAPKATPEPAKDAGAIPVNNKALGILTKNCAGCHTAGKLAEDTDFEMFDTAGKIRNLTDRQWGKVGTSTSTGRMPKKPKAPLTDEDSAILQEWLDNRK